MKIKIIKRSLMMAVIGLTGLLSMQTASAGWIDWTSTSAGTLDIGGTSVGVTLTGNPFGLTNGDYYYNNGPTGGVSPGGTYAGLAPSDTIHISNPGTFTLTFDQTVSDLNMALVSVGQPNLGVTYDFNNSFSILSTGSNYWGYGGYAVNGNNLTGYEFNGVLQFAGSFDSISFSTDPREYWHGFNFGSASLANNVSEPEPFALLLLGIAGLVLTRKRMA